MKPRINNPAFVRAIQDVIDALPSEPADQINADLNVTGFSEFLGGTGSMCAWWGDIGSNVYTNDQSVGPGQRRVRHPARLGRCLQLSDGPVGHFADGPNYAPNMAYLGWGVYVMARVDSDPVKQKAAWSSRGIPGRKGHISLVVGVSLRVPAVSQ